jgi:hypothetical protein
VNGGSQVEGLQTTTAGITVSEGASHGIEDIFIFAQRFSTTSGAASSSVLRIFSPPGISPTPVCPELSLIMTILRVKNGACAPLRFINMLSWPATGMICMEVTTGVVKVLIVQSFYQ